MVLDRRRVFLYIRDDDVYKKDYLFEKLFYYFISKKIPINYAVIPQKLKESLIHFLYKNCKYKNMFSVLQHGYSHKNNIKDLTKVKYGCEFGCGMDYEFQFKGILRGYSILSTKLKDFFLPVYVPPFHEYDYDTVKVCRKIGIKAISSSKKEFKSKVISFLRCDININEYDDRNDPLPINLDFLINLTYEKLRKYKLVGVYYHHDTLNNTVEFKKFIKYINFLVNLRKKGVIIIGNLSNLEFK